MKKILLLIAFLLPGYLVAGTCNNASITGYYAASGSSAQKVGSTTHPFVDAGRFVFSGTGGNGTGSVTYSGEQIRDNGNRYAVTGTGAYTVTTTCAVTVAVDWTVAGVVVPGVTYHFYASRVNTVPATSVVYTLDGIETTPLTATNPMTFASGVKSGLWSATRVDQ